MEGMKGKRLDLATLNELESKKKLGQSEDEHGNEPQERKKAGRKGESRKKQVLINFTEEEYKIVEQAMLDDKSDKRTLKLAVFVRQKALDNL